MAKKNRSDYEYEYAKSIFIKNPIKSSEMKYYKGLIKGKSPHGINNDVWKRAYRWAKKNKQIMVI